MLLRRSVLLGWLLLGLTIAQAGEMPWLDADQWAGKKSLPEETIIALSKGDDPDPKSQRYAVQFSDSRREWRIISLSHGGGERSVLVSQDPEVKLESTTAKLPEIGGLAVWNRRAVISLTRRQELVFVDLEKGKITARQSLPDFPTPRGVAYDPQGRLWVLSGNSLTEIQFTSDGHFNPLHHRGDFDDPRHLFIDAAGKFYLTEATEPATIKVLSPKWELQQTHRVPAGKVPVGFVMDPDATVQVQLRDGSRVGIGAK